MERYAVFGNPISHSKSPFIHTRFAKQTLQNLSYEAIEAPKDGFAKALSQFWQAAGKGCNVTAPFKEQAFALADKLSPRAQLAGAVNTLKRGDDGSIYGDTTDGAGLVASLEHEFGSLAQRRILLLGAGGAARGVIQSLLEAQCSELVIANRTEAKAYQLSEIFASLGKVSGCGFAALKGEFDIIINSTSAGFSGQLPAISGALIAAHSCVYDMNYGAPSAFLQWAHQQGASQLSDGLGMLVGQAAESFLLWRGVRPDTAPVLRELRHKLSL